MANPTARQRLVMEMVRQAASNMPLMFARGTPVENGLNSVGITFSALDANWAAVNPVNNQPTEALARAIEASRLNANNTFIDAFFQGEKHRQESVLDTSATNQQAAATATQAEADAIAGVTF